MVHRLLTLVAVTIIIKQADCSFSDSTSGVIFTPLFLAPYRLQTRMFPERSIVTKILPFGENLISETCAP